MKFLLSYLAVAAFIAALSSRSGAAQFGNFTYLDGGGQVAITGYLKTATGLVAIPASIQGKPVRTIARSAFESCTQISGVTFPAGLKTIEEDAFRFCRGMTGAINLPGGLNYVGANAFAYCDGITTLSIPASLTAVAHNSFSPCARLQSVTVDAGNPYFRSVGGVMFQKLDSILVLYPPGKSGAYSIPAGTRQVGPQAFLGCIGLTAVALPAGLTIIDDWAFHGCGSLKKVIIPAGVTRVGAGGFMHCSDLETIQLPPSLTHLGTSVFSACFSLKSVTIPAGITSLGDAAFANCSSLAAIGVASGNPNFASVDGVILDRDRKQLLHYPAGRAGDYTVPGMVTAIGPYAFSGCHSLTEVTLPAGLTRIGTGGFDRCTGLEKIVLPVGVQTIDGSGFWGCSGLREVSIPGTVTSLGIYAFYGCTGLLEAEFRGNAPTMGFGVFNAGRSDFKIAYFSDKVGFATPKWLGHATENRGQFVPRPARLAIYEATGIEWLPGEAAAASIGKIQLGGAIRVVLTFRNTGETPLAGLAANLDGSDAFEISGSFPTTLDSGSVTKVELLFRPTSAGAQTTRLIVTSAGESPLHFALTAEGVAPAAPEIDLFVKSGSSLKDGKSKVSMGARPVGKSGNAKTFTIRNLGNAKLSGLKIRVTGSHPKDFLLTQPAKPSLMPRAATTFQLHFQPRAAGTRSATLRVTSNDADEATFDVRLTGMGAK